MIEPQTDGVFASAYLLQEHSSDHPSPGGLPAAAHPSVLCKQRGGNLSRGERKAIRSGQRKEDEMTIERKGGTRMKASVRVASVAGRPGLAHPITGSFNSAGSALSANIHNAIRYNCWPGLRFNSVLINLQHHL